MLAVTEEGPHSYDPDYLLVHQLAYRLHGDQMWLILDRVNQEQQFLQGKRRADGRYHLEYRAGGPERHFAAYVDAWHVFVRSFFLYACGAGGWRQEIDWRILRLAS